jgi:hypothetical protein
MRLSVALALSLLLLGPECAHAPPAPESPRAVVQEQGTRGGQPYVKLTFRPLLAGAARERLAPEEVRTLVYALEELLGSPEWRASVGVSHPSLPSGSMSEVPESPQERWSRILRHYSALYGASSQPLPEALLEEEKFARAFMLSIKYMPEGVRAGAQELFTSRTVILALIASGLTYLGLWLAPEPVLSKMIAAGLTVALMLAYGVAEIVHVAKVFMQFYQEVSEAQSLEALEAAARRFGEALGKVGVRILAMVVGGAVSKALAKTPLPDMGSLLPSLQRFVAAGAGGGQVQVTVVVGAAAQVDVAAGTLVLMGTSVGTAEAALTAALASPRTSGDCRPESNKGSARKHHIATDKNRVSDATVAPGHHSSKNECDMRIKGRWHLSAPVGAVGEELDPWQFKEGREQSAALARRNPCTPARMSRLLRERGRPTYCASASNWRFISSARSSPRACSAAETLAPSSPCVSTSSQLNCTALKMLPCRSKGAMKPPTMRVSIAGASEGWSWLRLKNCVVACPLPGW